MLLFVQASEGGQQDWSEVFREKLLSIVDELAQNIYFISGSALSVSLIVLGFLLAPEANQEILRRTENLDEIVRRSRRFVRSWAKHIPFAVFVPIALVYIPVSNLWFTVLAVGLGVVLVYIWRRVIAAGRSAVRLSREAHRTVRFQIGLIYTVFIAAFTFACMWAHSIASAVTGSGFEVLSFLVLYFTTSLFISFFLIGDELFRYMARFSEQDLPDPADTPTIRIRFVNIISQRRPLTDLSIADVWQRLTRWFRRRG